MIRNRRTKFWLENSGLQNRLVCHPVSRPRRESRGRFPRGKLSDAYLNVFLNVHHELTMYWLPTWCTNFYLFI